MNWRRNWKLVRQTYKEFGDDNAMQLGAALAFYTAISITPLLLVVIGIAGLAYGDQAARGEIAHQLRETVGTEGAEALQAALARSASPRGGVLATVIGVATLVFGASGVFSSLQDALNVVWNVKAEKSRGGVWGLVRERLLSVTMIGVMAFLLLVSMVFGAALTGLGGAFERWLPYSSVWLGVGNFLLGFVLTTLMFAMIFKVLPRPHVAWSDVWTGAVLTAGLFALGKFLIGEYLGRASVGSTFGAAGSFVVLLTWIYYSSLILLFGAEFTQVYALRHGTGPRAVAGLPPADPAGKTAAWTTPPGEAVPDMV